MNIERFNPVDDKVVPIKESSAIFPRQKKDQEDQEKNENPRHGKSTFPLKNKSEEIDKGKNVDTYA